MIVFAIPVRDALPMPHNSTFTKVLDHELDLLSDSAYLVTDEGSHMPGSAAGHNIASLRFWQCPREASTEDKQLLDSAMQVLEAVAGDEAETPELDVDEGQDQSWYRTIVEAVTIVERPIDLVATESRADPLSTCLEVLFDLVRAYRVSANVRISELTYERVGPIVPYRWRALSPPTFFGPPFLMLLEHANVSTPDPGILTQEQLDNQTQVMTRLRQGDPFWIYAERRLEAMIALYRDGQYAESAIQSAIAAEVLLGGVLSLLLWEDSLPHGSIETPAGVLSTDIAKRVRTQYHPRLGGQWTLQGDGPVARWYGVTAQLRNRVVHRGYRPGYDDAMESVNVLLDLERFVCDRLAENSDRFPRSALVVLGAAGLRRRGKWSTSRFGDDAIGPITEFLRQFIDWRRNVDDEIVLILRGRSGPTHKWSWRRWESR
jgi:hypothetical protein